VFPLAIAFNTPAFRFDEQCGIDRRPQFINQVIHIHAGDRIGGRFFQPAEAAFSMSRAVCYIRIVAQDKLHEGVEPLVYRNHAYQDAGVCLCGFDAAHDVRYWKPRLGVLIGAFQEALLRGSASFQSIFEINLFRVILAEYERDQEGFLAAFQTVSNSLGAEDKSFMAKNMIEYVWEIYGDGHSEHRQSFILLNKENGRESRQGGYAFFGNGPIALKNLVLGCLQSLLDKPDHGIDLGNSVIDVCFGKGYRLRGAIPHLPRGQEVEPASFSPSDKIPELENHCFLNMAFGLSSGKWFPYFKPELMPLLARSGDIEQEYGDGEGEILLSFIARMISYRCSGGMVLRLEYEGVEDVDKIVPHVEEVNTGDRRIWKVCQHDADLEKTFLNLENHQSSEYHEWEDLRDRPQGAIGDRLCEISLGKRTRELISLKTLT